MDLVRDQLRSFLSKYYVLDKDIYTDDHKKASFLKFLVDRRNASLGDSLINFIYSCTKSMALEECTGIKISDDILIQGFYASELFTWLKIPGKKKDQANAIEALIFYMWLVFEYSIEEMAINLLSKLQNTTLNLNNVIEEKRIASLAFTNLFDSFNILIKN